MSEPFAEGAVSCLMELYRVSSTEMVSMLKKAHKNPKVAVKLLTTRILHGFWTGPPPPLEAVGAEVEHRDYLIAPPPAVDHAIHAEDGVNPGIGPHEDEGPEDMWAHWDTISEAIVQEFSVSEELPTPEVTFPPEVEIALATCPPIKFGSFHEMEFKLKMQLSRMFTRSLMGRLRVLAR